MHADAGGKICNFAHVSYKTIHRSTIFYMKKRRRRITTTTATTMTKQKQGEEEEEEQQQQQQLQEKGRTAATKGGTDKVTDLWLRCARRLPAGDSASVAAAAPGTGRAGGWSRMTTWTDGSQSQLLCSCSLAPPSSPSWQFPPASSAPLLPPLKPAGTQYCQGWPDRRFVFSPNTAVRANT